MSKHKQTRSEYLEKKRKHAERENKLAQMKVDPQVVIKRLEQERIDKIEEHERAVFEEQQRKRDAFLKTLTPEQRAVWLENNRKRQMELARTLGTMAGLGMLGDPFNE